MSYYITCLWCNSQLQSNTKICPVCGFSQEIKIASDRTDDCLCHSGKMLIVTNTDHNGKKINRCSDCISPAALQQTAKILIEEYNDFFPNQEVHDKVMSLVNGYRYKYHYNETEQKAALAEVVGFIHATREKGSSKLPPSE